jgi:hypothetical protein
MSPGPSNVWGRYPAKVKESSEMMRKVLGRDSADDILNACMGECGIPNIEAITSADRLMRLAWALIRRGGFPELVGRNLKVHAILGGAHASP